MARLKSKGPIRLLVDCSEDKREALIAFLKALKIEFEKYPYSKEFIAKMERAEADKAAGHEVVIKLEDIWK